MPQDQDTVYFWNPEGDTDYLSQWYPCRFVSTFNDGTKTEYHNCEQYMMHSKGLLFAPDSPVTAKILKTTNPAAIQKLGRQIPNFDGEVWNEKRYGIVRDGNMMKFSQGAELKRRLLETGEKELVEASPFDRVWGVGFETSVAGSNRDKWGLNLLGKAVMEVRSKLGEEEEKEKA